MYAQVGRWNGVRTPQAQLLGRREFVGGWERRDGRYWTRTSDPCGVNTVLYRLS